MWACMMSCFARIDCIPGPGRVGSFLCNYTKFNFISNPLKTDSYTSFEVISWFVLNLITFWTSMRLLQGWIQTFFYMPFASVTFYISSSVGQLRNSTSSHGHLDQHVRIYYEILKWWFNIVSKSKVMNSNIVSVMHPYFN
jgi:hypothetical protein